MAKIDRIARLLALANGGSGSGTNISMEIVDTLPEVGESGVIYLVKKTGKKKDIYDEYMYVNNDWELIGNTDIDLSTYATKTYVDDNGIYRVKLDIQEEMEGQDIVMGDTPGNAITEFPIATFPKFQSFIQGLLDNKIITPQTFTDSLTRWQVIEKPIKFSVVFGDWDVLDKSIDCTFDYGSVWPISSTDHTYLFTLIGTFPIANVPHINSREEDIFRLQSRDVAFLFALDQNLNVISVKSIIVLSYCPHEVGNLNNLTTTAKDNLVNAVNEVETQIGDINTILATLTIPTDNTPQA